MKRRPPRSTRTYTLFPYTTLFRSHTGGMKLGAADASGRQVPVEIENADFDQPADLVIKALGFDPEDLPAQFRAPELDVPRWGTVKISARSKMTNLPGVFAAGDIGRGASRSDGRRVGQECGSRFGPRGC